MQQADAWTTTADKRIVLSGMHTNHVRVFFLTNVKKMVYYFFGRSFRWGNFRNYIKCSDESDDRHAPKTTERTADDLRREPSFTLATLAPDRSRSSSPPSGPSSSLPADQAEGTASCRMGIGSRRT